MNFDRLLLQKLKEYLLHKESIMLLGPRQTGKSTLINELLNSLKTEKLVYELQNTSIFEELIKNPHSIVQAVEHKINLKNLILFIDEVQKIPALLDNCQYLKDKYKNNISIIVTGSSARKLRQKGVNLLPGRVLMDNLHSLIFNEIFEIEEQIILPIKFRAKKKNTLNNIALDDLLIFGALPGVLTKEKYKEKLLISYVSTYLEEEIRQEALTRNLGEFSNFLQLAALESNTAPNMSRLSQATGITLSTIQNYFKLLEDTLVTYSIPPFRDNKNLSRKQILSTPKYIFYENGVRNAAAKLPLNKNILNSEISGKIFEHFIVLEFVKRIKYEYPYWKYYFFRTNHGIEVDFVIETDEREIIPIEIKYTDTIQKKQIQHLNIFMDEFNCKRGYLVGLFKRPLKISDKITALPWNMI